MMTKINLVETIREVPDFPKPGILFYDITTLLQNGPAFQQTIDTLLERYQGRSIDAIVAMESRGFIFGAPLAYKMGVGLVPVRKPGKLPAETYQVSYDLEYGSNTLEIHRDALQPGARVLVIDDLLATGGTTVATCSLIEKLDATVEEIAFVIELTFLNGRDKLKDYTIHSLIQY
jgi:adenine phosphoribosyltransferase